MPFFMNLKIHTKIPLLSLIILTLSNCHDQGNGDKNEFIGESIPKINLLALDSTRTLNVATIQKGSPSVFFVFSPDCPFCRIQTEEFITNAEQISNLRFYMISISPLNQLKTYYSQYKLGKHSNFFIGQDYTYKFVEHFQIKSVPCTIIFGKDNKLIKIIRERMELDELKEYAY